MSDPVGNIRHCFTPLAAYIVDIPEACMLACVRGKTSPFTLASYLQFGDKFHHLACTRAITLEQLASINVDPNDLEGFFATCAEFRLNDVFVPFWMGWQFSDPAIFLTPEALHHWHKQFYDHDPITGYRHFPNGISKLKQVMGRVHRDIQCYIVGLIAGAAPRRFVVAIRALMDVRYLVQSPTLDDNSLTAINRSLATFHDNKDVIMTLGAQMLGTPIQWSTDATEHVHVSEIKDPARCTNNNNYDPQICHHLDREEKLHHFAVATSLKSFPTDPDLEELREDEGDENEEENGEDDELIDPQTALLEEFNHTRTTANYFSKIRM
ncbi:hypothetical protein DFJ58DRAFT_731903 [Suillus subalutaceus]|uniref:uncharacterized protein n=1 Tax=Suillus subalutaceus TaxID=48586 RepID=UPI001B87D296|nr:uncharacterized protein DFJ58DRAFT_731903 [Suillus subalutaceus]KAG1842744.1 hypothetical protein DFJ58DRAFT_731903 [Suillus subalutaceus]